MKTRKNKKRRAIGSFETMEDRKLFAADLIGAGDLVDGEAVALAEMDRLQTKIPFSVGDFGKPNPEEDGPLGPIGPVVHTIEQVASETVLSELGKPNPEDDDPPGPIGPVVQVAERLQTNEILGQAGMPAPDDDDPPGPIGPVYREAADWLADELIDPRIDPQLGELQTIMMNDTGAMEGKPDPGVDCDGNPLTAGCDIKAPELEPEAKPDPGIDCDGIPWTAACDLKAPELEPEAKPDPGIDCDGIPWTAACDLKAPELDPELWSNPGDTNGDGDSDFSDFLNLSRNFGNREATRAEGDLNGDKVVGFGDFLILSSYFGTNIPPLAVDAAFAS